MPARLSVQHVVSERQRDDEKIFCNAISTKAVSNFVDIRLTDAFSRAEKSKKSAAIKFSAANFPAGSSGYG